MFIEVPLCSGDIRAVRIVTLEEATTVLRMLGALVCLEVLLSEDNMLLPFHCPQTRTAAKPYTLLLTSAKWIQIVPNRPTRPPKWFPGPKMDPHGLQTK